MNRRTGRRIKRIMVVLVVLYVAGGVTLYFIQDQLLFHPKPVPMNYHYSFDLAFEEINIPYGKDNLSVIRFSANSPKKGVVVFYHGNRENVEHYAKYPAFFVRNGYDVWMADYPGFGKSTGRRSQAVIYEQALLAYDLAAKNAGSAPITIYGKSVGTGIASYVGAHRNCKRLILETPYYSVNVLARHYFPIYAMVPMAKYTFPVYLDLQQVNCPVSFFHGTADEVIPYRQAIRLKEEKPSVELITIQGGRHNDLSSFELFQKKIDSLLGQ